MKQWTTLAQYWRKLSITTKFSSAFGLLLFLILLVSATSILALTVVRRQTEAAIVTSTEIQRLVLEMNSGLETARRMEKDFSIRYTTTGFTPPRQKYARETSRQITKVMALSAELQQLITQPDVSKALQNSQVNLNFYFSAADRYRLAFEELVDLVATLANPETGLQAQLGQQSTLLLETIEQVDDPGLIILYREMQSFEKDFWATHQRPRMQSAFNIAFHLRQSVEDNALIDAGDKAQITTHLDNYLATAHKILQLDVDIQSKIHEFDLQIEAVNPIAEELIVLARTEVEHARNQNEKISRLATIILILTALLGILFATIVAKILNGSITQNIVKLTEATSKLQAGNRLVKVQVNSADELGQLADNFNAMSSQLDDTIGSLEQHVNSLQQAEEKREKLIVELEAKNAELERFTYTVSHDLKSPLVTIRGFVGLLEKDALAGDIERMKVDIKFIQGATDTMQRLLNDLLELSRVGRIVNPPEEVDMDELAHEATDLVTGQITRQEMQQIRILPNLPPAYGDRPRLLEVFQNLIDNAVKYMGNQPEPRIEIGARQKNNETVYYIKDNGIGIDLHYQNKVFGLFERLNTDIEGTGIGLALTKRIVEVHGGRIWVESDGKGFGSTFCFSLPSGRKNSPA